MHFLFWRMLFTWLTETSDKNKACNENKFQIIVGHDANYKNHLIDDAFYKSYTTIQIIKDKL
jgi:hypothetical protein